jgi:hypothetical protein
MIEHLLLYLLYMVVHCFWLIVLAGLLFFIVMISNFQWTLTHPPRIRLRNLYLSGLDCRGFTYSQRPRTPSFGSRLLMGNILFAQPIGHNSLGQSGVPIPNSSGKCGKQMQAVRLDPSPEQDPNG